VCPELFPDFQIFLGSWPETLEVSLERDISAAKFPGDDVAGAILVALTPVPPTPASEASGHAADPPKTTGRVDATMIVRRTDAETPEGQSNDSALAIVIESKIYGPVPDEQLQRYMNRLKEEKKRIKAVLVEVSWEEIYKLCESLPQAAEHDPIFSDFKEFLARDATLVGFTGFRPEDFAGDSQLPDSRARLDSKLQRFCDQVIGDGSDPVLGGGKPVRKRGGLDYDLPIAQQSLVGNIGLASWNQDTLDTKLAIGWRSHLDSDRALTNWDADDVADRIRQVSRGTTLRIDASVRPYFNRFDYDPVALWSKTVGPGDDAFEVWREAVDFTRIFHAKRMDKEKVEVLGISPARVTKGKESTITRAVTERVNCFVPLVLVASWQAKDLTGTRPEEQVRLVRGKLRELAALLVGLSGVGPS
jgi:hypothetical protein